MIISIIVPFYNTGELIKNSINSLKNQTNQNFEAIFINDGSTDNTLEILKKELETAHYAFNIINKENTGVSKSRNLGLNLAQGKYILFFDSDDFLNETLIEKIFLILNNQEVDGLIFSYNLIDENKTLITEKKIQLKNRIYKGKDIIKKILQRKLEVNVSSIILKSQILSNKNIKYVENLFYGEDQEFNIRYLYNCEDIYITSEILMSYVKHSESATSKKFNRKKYGFIEKNQYFRKLFKEEELLNLVNNCELEDLLYLSSKICMDFKWFEAKIELNNLKKRYFFLKNIQVASLKIKIGRTLFFHLSEFFFLLSKIKKLIIINKNK